jgi:hypothetical protein
VCHYAIVTVPFPAVIFETLNPPDGASVTTVIPDDDSVLLSGYFNTIYPENPFPPTYPLSCAYPCPPPPEPKVVAELGPGHDAYPHPPPFPPPL